MARAPQVSSSEPVPSVESPRGAPLTSGRGYVLGSWEELAVEDDLPVVDAAPVTLPSEVPGVYVPESSLVNEVATEPPSQTRVAGNLAKRLNRSVQGPLRNTSHLTAPRIAKRRHGGFPDKERESEVQVVKRTRGRPRGRGGSRSRCRRGRSSLLQMRNLPETHFPACANKCDRKPNPERPDLDTCRRACPHGHTVSCETRQPLVTEPSDVQDAGAGAFLRDDRPWLETFGPPTAPDPEPVRRILVPLSTPLPKAFPLRKRKTAKERNAEARSRYSRETHSLEVRVSKTGDGFSVTNKA